MTNREILIPERIPRPERINIRHDQVVTVDSERFVRVAESDVGYELASAENPSQRLHLTYEKIVELREQKRLRLELKANSTGYRRAERMLRTKVVAELSDYNQFVVTCKKRLFDAYEADMEKRSIPRSSRSFQKQWLNPKCVELFPVGPGQKKHNHEKAPDGCRYWLSTSAFNRGYRQYLSQGRMIESIIPNHHGPGQKSVAWCAEALSFAINEAYGYLDPDEPTYTNIYEMYEGNLALENLRRRKEGEEPLHKFGTTKFFSIINSFPKFDVVHEREGLAVAMERFRRNVAFHESALPGMEIQMDEWKGDLMTLVAKAGMLGKVDKKLHKHLKKIRIWFVVAICVHTRLVLAVHAAPTPNTEAALSALRLIMSDKTRLAVAAKAQGGWSQSAKPTKILMDNGSALRSDRLFQAMTALDIAPDHSAPKKPKSRPHIERLFRSIASKLLPFFSGRTFSNVVEKGDYDPSKHASLVVSEFVNAYILCVCDIYHHRPHRSLGCRSPKNVWNDAVAEYKFDPPPFNDQMLLAFGNVSQATIDNYGIQRNGIIYWNEHVTEMYKDRFKQKVEIIEDETNVFSILVKAKNGKWFEVENTTGVPDGVSKAEWQSEKKRLLDENKAETALDAPVVHEARLKLAALGKKGAERIGLPTERTPQEKIDRAKARVYTGAAKKMRSRPSVADAFDEYKASIAPPPGNLEVPSVGAPGEKAPPIQASKFNIEREED